MGRDSAEIAETILRRVEIEYRKDKLRKEKRKAAALTAICFAGCLALAVCLIALPLFYSGAGLPAAPGSVIVYERAVVGGYALMGVIGFSLGVTAALVWLNRRKRAERRQDGTQAMTGKEGGSHDAEQ